MAELPATVWRDSSGAPLLSTQGQVVGIIALGKAGYAYS
jgi:hypothetical protein